MYGTESRLWHATPVRRGCSARQVMASPLVLPPVEVLDDREETDTYDTIPLSLQGCGYYDLLVVNGQDAGHAWFDGRATDGPIAPHVDDLGRHLRPLASDVARPS